MGMTSLNISLPQTLKDYVEDRTKNGGFSTPSEFVRNLVRDDQKRHAEEKLEALLLEGLRSGESITFTPDQLEKKRQRLREKFARKPRPK